MCCIMRCVLVLRENINDQTNAMLHNSSDMSTIRLIEGCQQSGVRLTSSGEHAHRISIQEFRLTQTNKV